MSDRREHQDCRNQTPTNEPMQNHSPNRACHCHPAENEGGLSRRLLNLAECGGRSSSRLYSCSPSVTIEFAVTGGYADSGPLTIVDREPILAVAR